MANYTWFGQWISGTTYNKNTFVKNGNICFVSTNNFYSVLSPDQDMGNWNVFIIGLTGTTVTPTPNNTVTPTITPTITPTTTPSVTPSVTCSVVTQYMEVNLGGCSNFSLKLYNDSGFTSNANALCNYVVSGVARGDMGTIFYGSETILNGDHVHTFNLNSILQPGECVASFGVINVDTSSCQCPVIVDFTPFIVTTPTPTPTVTPTNTPTITPTETPTNTPTNTVTPTVTVTPTTTVTPSVSNPLDGAYYYISTSDYAVCYDSVPSDIIYGQNGLNVGQILYQDAAATNPYTISELQLLLSTTATTFYVRAIIGGDTFTIGDNGGGDAIAQSQSPCVSSTPTATPTVTPTITPSETPTNTPTNTPTPSITPTNTVTPTPSITISPSVTPTHTVTPTNTVTPTPSITISPSVTPTHTVTPTNTVTPTITPSPTTPSAPQPATVGLVAWYNIPATGADWTPSNPINGTLIGNWNDTSQSLYGIHNLGADGGNNGKPTYTTNVQNGQPMLLFNGSQNRMSATGFSSIAGQGFICLFVVTKFNGTVSPQTITTNATRGMNITISGATSRYQIGMAGGIGEDSGSTVDTSVHIHTVLFNSGATGNGNRLIYRRDGIQKTLDFKSTSVGVSTNPTSTILYLGQTSSGTELLNGYQGEIIIYNTLLTNSEILNTENYLKNKWGIF